MEKSHAQLWDNQSFVFVRQKTQALAFTATGNGRRQRCRTDKFGFPSVHIPNAKTFQNYQTGDIVKAVVAKGKAAGTHQGRIIIRHRPSFLLNGFDIHPKFMTLAHQADGYDYQVKRKSISG